MTVRLALLGAGSHCHNEHIPALKQLRDQADAPGSLVAVCDRDADKAQRVANEFPGISVFTDLDAMIEAGGVDGIIAVTPTPITAQIAIKIMEAGIPLSMEKPLGIDMAEADAVLACQERHNAKVVVGMNRRFDPLLSKAAELLAEHTPAFARYCLHRQARTESGFIEDVCIHALDWLGSALGKPELEHVTPLPLLEGEGLIAQYRCGNVPTILEVLPTVGIWTESFTIGGSGWCLQLDWGEGLSLKGKGFEPIIIGPPSKGSSTYLKPWDLLTPLMAVGRGRRRWQRCTPEWPPPSTSAKSATQQNRPRYNEPTPRGPSLFV